jgi:hypothetical protein
MSAYADFLEGYSDRFYLPPSKYEGAAKIEALYSAIHFCFLRALRAEIHPSLTEVDVAFWRLAAEGWLESLIAWRGLFEDES